MSAPEEPKIIIDTDWKSQARAEKERLAHATVKPAPAPSGTAIPGAEPGGPPAPPGPGGPPEKVGFRDLLSLLISQSLAYMGAYPDPRTGQAVVALDLARFHIDLLEILEEKTKGNLTDEESRVLTRALNELRLEYVEVAKAIARAVQEGRATTVSPGSVTQAAGSTGPGPKLKFPTPGVGGP